MTGDGGDDRTHHRTWRTAIKAILAAFLSLAISAGAALAGSADQVRATYRHFAEAQNAHDLERIGAFFVDGLEFLWISDGKSVWGREAVLARMSGVQKAVIWRVAALLTTTEKP